MRIAKQYAFRLELLRVQLVDEDGRLRLRGPEYLRASISGRIRERILALEPELRSLRGWSAEPDECRGCGSTGFHRRTDGTWGCSGCFPEAAELLDGPGPPVTLKHAIEALNLTPANEAGNMPAEELGGLPRRSEQALGAVAEVHNPSLRKP